MRVVNPSLVGLLRQGPITGCLPNQGNQGNQGKIRELGQNLGKSGKNQGNYMYLLHITNFISVNIPEHTIFFLPFEN